jgi:ABC-type polysaccharide/polyol phosphate export permease
MLMTGVYFILVAVLFRGRGSNQPYIMYVLCGLLAWKAFSDSLSQSIQSIVTKANIIRSIGFPKAVIPMSLVLSNTVYFLFGLLVAAGVGIWYGPEHGTWPNAYYLMLPVVIFLQFLLTAGFALALSAAGVLFRDSQNIARHVLRMWYFLSPGIYSLDRVPLVLQPYFRLNPFCQLMTAYRDILMYGRMPASYDLAYALGVGMVTLLLGYWIFRRLEDKLVQNL